jgi:hypothetical protein
MKAAVYREYGPLEVIGIEEVEKPVPRDYQVLVRTVGTWDCEARSFSSRSGSGSRCDWPWESAGRAGPCSVRSSPGTSADAAREPWS